MAGGVSKRAQNRLVFGMNWMIGDVSGAGERVFWVEVRGEGSACLEGGDGLGRLTSGGRHANPAGCRLGLGRTER